MFPLKAGAARPDRQKLNELVKVLQDGSSSLFLAMHSPPSSISMEAGEKSNRIADRVIGVLAFANALLVADKAALTGNQLWSWDEARAAYLADRGKHPSLPEWDDVLLGKPFAGLPDELSEFQFKLLSFQTGAK